MSRIYSSLKFLSFSEQIDALMEQRMAPPVHIRIKPTNHCNHHCWYCAYRYDDLLLGSDMDERDRLPEAKMHELADDIVDMGVRAVTFSGGGEPLLYKPLPEIVEKLAKGGVRVATLTNGSNLQGRMAEAFAEHGTWIRVSLDAWDDESYSQSRGARPGDFDRLIRNMRAFVATGTDCVLGVSFIVGEDNHRHVFEVCSLMKDVGVDHVKISGSIVGNDPNENNRYHRGLKETVADEIERARGLEDASFHVVNHYHDLEDRFDKPCTLCPYLMFLTVVGADGVVYTCQDKAYTKTGVLGSIRDRSFKDFWFSEENRRRIFSFNPAENCRHHCISHAKNLSVLEFMNLDPDHKVFV